MNALVHMLCVVALATAFLTTVTQHVAAHAFARTSTWTAGVLLGPCGSPAARGPIGTDDDFTNRAIDAGAVIIRDGQTLSQATVVFRNTLENTGPRDDAFIVNSPAAPAGFRVEVSTDFGNSYTPLDAGSQNVTIPVSYRASSTFFVRVTAPPGVRVLNGYDVVIRARSTVDPTIANETIDRLYAGFIRLEVKTTVVGAALNVEVARAVPGSEIEFVVTYMNISSAAGEGNSLLTAYNLVIHQDGNAAPNNWGSVTEHVVGASDNQGGLIVGDREGSTSLTDIVMLLDPGRSGVFRFRRRVK